MAIVPPFQQRPIDPRSGFFTLPWVQWLLRCSDATNNAAPADAQYVLGAADSALTNGRVATSTATVTVDIATPNIIAWNAVAQVPMHYATVDLTNAEIKALPTTFKQVVPAPGAGKALVFWWGWFQIIATAGAYTNITPGRLKGFEFVGGNWDIELSNYYTTWTGGSLRRMLTPYVDVSDAAQLLAGFTGSQTFVSLEGDNLPIQFLAWEDLGNFTGGNAANTGKAAVVYSTLNLTTGALS